MCAEIVAHRAIFTTYTGSTSFQTDRFKGQQGQSEIRQKRLLHALHLSSLPHYFIFSVIVFLFLIPFCHQRHFFPPIPCVHVFVWQTSRSTLGVREDLSKCWGSSISLFLSLSHKYADMYLFQEIMICTVLMCD